MRQTDGIGVARLLFIYKCDSLCLFTISIELELEAFAIGYFIKWLRLFLGRVLRPRDVSSRSIHYLLCRNSETNDIG